MQNQFVSSTFCLIGAQSLEVCMMNFKQNEEAVSPVIGVILMVAITVILAAVIAAFVLGMGENLPENKDVYVTTKLGAIPGDGDGADSDKRVMIVTIQGGKDVSSLEAVKHRGVYRGVESDEDGGSTFAELNLFGGDGEMWNAPYEIGSSGYIDLSGATGTSNIIIRGEFADGSVTILANKDYVGGTSSQDDDES